MILARTNAPALALLFFSAFAYFVAPFRYGDRQVFVPPAGELDATLATLAVADRTDKLLTDPAAFYDMDILYPDRNQLRSTEPFLGFVLLALPLRAVPYLNDVDVYETLRWLLIFVSLTYAYLLSRALGLGPALSLAGAVMCWSHGWLLNGIERLQVLSIPLLLPVIHHGLMLWTGSGPPRVHGVALFAFAALYPLCGAINATVAAVCGLLVLPWLLAAAVGVSRQRRLAACVVPLVLAAAFDAVALAPWMLDRADLAVYASDAFLEVKHWTPTRLPTRVQNVPPYVAGMIGRGLGTALLLLAVLAVAQRIRQRAGTGAAPREGSSGAVKSLWLLLASAAAVATAYVLHAGTLVLSWLSLVFHIVSWAALALFWRAQVLRRADDAHGAVSRAAMLTAGLGVFLCLMSFGPQYVSNTGPLANQIVRVLLEVLPPLKLIREYYRIWVFGMLFLSLFATLRLGAALRRHGPLLRTAAAAAIVAATMSSVFDRELVASADIEAPADIVRAAAHSRGSAGLYVHPDMNWNSRSGVLMIALARELQRPIVNGYLGLVPPWFGYASSVLHRFPDPEALWLLHRWNIHTVISLPEAVAVTPSALIERSFEDAGLIVWEVAAAAKNLRHPSKAGAALVEHARVEAVWHRADNGSVAAVAVKVPASFKAAAVEVHFGQSAVERIPSAIAVYAFDGSRGVRVNDGQAGEWIESLAADALLRRESPVATIALLGTVTSGLLVEFPNAERPPLERIVLLGHWGE